MGLTKQADRSGGHHPSSSPFANSAAAPSPNSTSAPPQSTRPTADTAFPSSDPAKPTKSPSPSTATAPVQQDFRSYLRPSLHGLPEKVFQPGRHLPHAESRGQTMVDCHPATMILRIVQNDQGHSLPPNLMRDAMDSEREEREGRLREAGFEEPDEE